MGDAGWWFWVDRGGTLTEIVARRPDSRLGTQKPLSDKPGRGRDVAVAGIGAQLGSRVRPGAGRRVEAVRMGPRSRPARCSNAKGARTDLVLTKGFANARLIAYQNRTGSSADTSCSPRPWVSHVGKHRRTLAAAFVNHRLVEQLRGPCPARPSACAQTVHGVRSILHCSPALHCHHPSQGGSTCCQVRMLPQPGQIFPSSQLFMLPLAVRGGSRSRAEIRTIV